MGGGQPPDRVGGAEPRQLSPLPLTASLLTFGCHSVANVVIQFEFSKKQALRQEFEQPVIYLEIIPGNTGSRMGK